ncbi:CaiB/BaiF CoA transferase family protein [Sneathiella sp.]|uniref:CaiB/BaiF CoA transferase family protein n=1 Tax=Sneathiella sp. TaxID=1964365 RepID=UPI003569390A
MTTDNAAVKGPLTGCCVVELGSTVAGPFCGRLYADLGASVICIEKPSGDALRGMGRQFNGKSLWWTSMHRNKETVAINMKSGEGRHIVRDLVRKADILIENFKPGTLEKWGLGYDEISRDNPGLVLVRISGFGQTGPYSKRAGFGIIGESLSGIRSITGEPDRPPARVATPVTDYVAGLYGAFGGLAAMQERHRTGRGQVVDVALYESSFSLMENFVPTFEKLGIVPTRVGSRLHGHVPNSLFPVKNDEWIHIAAGNDTTFDRLAVAMGKPELLDMSKFNNGPARLANEEEIVGLIGDWTRNWSLNDLYEFLVEQDIPAAPIYTIADVFEDPQFAAREMILNVPDDEMGQVKLSGIVPKFSNSPGEVRWTGGVIGKDTRAVLSRELGYSEIELSTLEKSGAISSHSNNGAG